VEQQDEGMKRLEERLEKQYDCEARGHPFEHKVVVPYNGGHSQVLVKCSGCGASYGRDPTDQEVEDYEETTKTESDD